MNKESVVKKNISSRLDKISGAILLVGIFLTPLITLPFFNLSPEIFKKFFLVGFVLVSLGLWFMARFKEKKISIAKTPILSVSGIFLILTLISSLLASSKYTSLVGLGFEGGTFLSLTSLFGLLFIVSEYTRSKQKFLNVYLGLLIVFAVAFLFQLIRLSFGNFLPWSFFDNAAVNLVGKWNDLGMFAGLMTLSSVVMLELFPLKEARVMKNFIWGVLISSLLTLALVNFTLLWIVLAVILVLVYVYQLSFLSGRPSGKGKVMKVSIVVFLISLIFIIFGQPISLDAQGKIHEGILAKQTRVLSEKIGIASLEVRPSFTGTYALTKDSLKNDLIFGSGPNTFAYSWLKNKPTGVNESQFWNIEPSFGFGFIISFFVTTGLFGGLSLIILVGLLIYFGSKALLNSKIDSLEKSFLILSFAGLIYVWSLMILYVPETSMLLITFVITGLFIARLVDVGEIKTTEISLTANPKTKFVSYILGSLAVLSFAFLSVAWITTGFAFLAFQNSIKYLQTATLNTDKAEKYINLAIGLNPQDFYYRFASQVNMAQMNILLGKKMSQDELMTAYSKIFEKAKKNVDAAVLSGPENYLNYVSRGALYENIMSLGVKGAYELSKENYTKAIDYNTHGPDMYLNLARLEILNKNYTEAEKYLDKALLEKKNYIDAIFLQSQLYAERGFLDSAIKRAEYASQLAPADISILFQLGYLKYRNADYRGAIKVLKTATSLTPNFANAKYFLGLSYDKVGLTDSAIKEFSEIEKNNPGNTELTQILTNLRAGRDALVGAEPVEKKVKAPVKGD